MAVSIGSPLAIAKEQTFVLWSGLTVVLAPERVASMLRRPGRDVAGYKYVHCTPSNFRHQL